MLNFSFRVWLEDDQKPKMIKDPYGVSQTWLHALPKDVGGVEPQNDSAIWRFVDVMADPAKNGPLIHLCCTKGNGARIPSFSKEERYNEKIGGNLIHDDSHLLKNAHGVVTSVMKETMFGFAPEGPMVGSMIIMCPPLSFSMTDKLLLASVIRHESRHAADFVAMGGKTMGQKPSASVADLDLDEYASCIVEARAWSDQLRWLLRMLGNSKAVITAIEDERSFFNFDPGFRKTARYFLEAMEKEVKTEAAFVNGGSIFDSPIKISRTRGNDNRRLERQLDPKKLEQAAMLTLHIISRFSFSENVKVDSTIKARVHGQH